MSDCQLPRFVSSLSDDIVPLLLFLLLFRGLAQANLCCDQGCVDWELQQAAIMRPP